LKSFPNWRRSFLPCAVLLILVSGASRAGADQVPAPSPQGDDIAFLQLGSVGEMTTLALFREAARSEALAGAERKAFGRLAGQAAKAWRNLNGLLGEDALTDEDFDIEIPGRVLRSRRATLALAARFELLLSGVYLNGVQSAIDPPTRLVLGKHLEAGVRDLTLIRQLRGGKGVMRLPKPLSVPYVGVHFERFLVIPGA
jgi:hypothetical protein